MLALLLAVVAVASSSAVVGGGATTPMWAFPGGLVMATDRILLIGHSCNQGAGMLLRDADDESGHFLRNNTAVPYVRALRQHLEKCTTDSEKLVSVCQFELRKWLVGRTFAVPLNRVMELFSDDAKHCTCELAPPRITDATAGLKATTCTPLGTHIMLIRGTYKRDEQKVSSYSLVIAADEAEAISAIWKPPTTD